MFMNPYIYVYPHGASWLYYEPVSIHQPVRVYSPVHPLSYTTMSIDVRPYPDVDPTLFNQSAIAMQTLMKDASILLNKLAESKEFDSKIMKAAQQSNSKAVDELIKSTGIQSTVNTSFNPDGIQLKLSSKAGGTECCHLTITLRWM